MIIAVAGLMGGLVLGDYATKSVLIGKAGTFLAEAEAAIVKVVADFSPDIRSVIERLIEESRSPLLPAASPRPVGGVGPNPVRRRNEGHEPDDIGGTLIHVSGDWYVRFEGGGGKLAPLISSAFDASKLDKSQAYPVFGRLMMLEGQATGFLANEVVVAVTGRV
jgi:hypothetical protein